MTNSYQVRPEDGPVLVTGATGYVAGWVIQALLDAGLTVHAAVRDPDNARKLAQLVAIADASPGSIRFFKADLLDPHGHDEAMQGCRIVMHTASPFITAEKISDPQRDLVEPAQAGTRNVLNAVNRTESVRRVVLTSSLVAVHGGSATSYFASDHPLTEADWNTYSSLENAPYPYSKTVAEQTAWEIAKAQTRWKLVVINPGFVLGPSVGEVRTSASFDHIRAVGAGGYAQGVPPMEIGMVDVRDVADAHMRAAFIEAAEGRHLVYGEVLSLGDIIQMLKEEFGDDPWPFPETTAAPADVVHWQADNSKSKRALGLAYRPIKAAVVATFQQLIDSGELTAPSGEERNSI
jgi:dihydroflavonol-4-reductase